MSEKRISELTAFTDFDPNDLIPVVDVSDSNVSTKTKVYTITEITSGNSGSATKLNTTRNIAGVAFDGTADINIPFTNLSSKPTTVGGYGITDTVISGKAVLPTVLTVGASPFVFHNTNAYPVDIITNSGTVTSIEFSRDNTTFYNTGTISGIINLSANDYIRVTYTVLPNMIAIPR
jgi:hypothetical protein